MERAMGVVGIGGGRGRGGGGSVGGSTSGGPLSTVSKEEEVVEQDSDMGVSSVEVSSYPDESELELGLGLSLGGGGAGGGCLKVVSKQVPRILTARDLPSIVSRPLIATSPSSASSCSSVGRANNNVSAGTKRTADSVTSPTGVRSLESSQVVGWPPIRTYRMNSLANQAKSHATGELNSNIDDNKGKGVIYGSGNNTDAKPMQRGHVKTSFFVKVNMDGIGIGRKVDLRAHSGYGSLAQALEEMFTIPSRNVDALSGEMNGAASKARRASKLLDGSSDYVLTYEDKDGDWMLVGDVPWGMFLGSVKRLRIMKTSEANGLTPRFEEINGKQRTKPI